MLITLLPGFSTIKINDCTPYTFSWRKVSLYPPPNKKNDPFNYDTEDQKTLGTASSSR